MPKTVHLEVYEREMVGFFSQNTRRNLGHKFIYLACLESLNVVLEAI